MLGNNFSHDASVRVAERPRSLHHALRKTSGYTGLRRVPASVSDPIYSPSWSHAIEATHRSLQHARGLSLDGAGQFRLVSDRRRHERTEMKPSD